MEDLWRVLRRRRSAYREVFGAGGHTRSQAIVLADLARWCSAQKTTYVAGDPDGAKYLEGRRQVWIRIQGYLRLTEEEIDALAEQAEG